MASCSARELYDDLRQIEVTNAPLDDPDGTIREALLHPLGDSKPLPELLQLVATTLGEDGLDGGDDHVGVGPLHPGQDVPHEVHPAALPGRAHHHRLDGLLEPQVLVGDDQADAFQPPGPERPQELGPKGPVL